jgi:hypothetical protein
VPWLSRGAGAGRKADRKNSIGRDNRPYFAAWGKPGGENRIGKATSRRGDGSQRALRQLKRYELVKLALTTATTFVVVIGGLDAGLIWLWHVLH